AGNLWENLLQKIEDCEFFIAIMSRAYSESESCQRELAYATEHQREIVPVRFYNYVADNLSQCHYAPFMEDFEQGFRWLTQAILQEPKSSWEYIGHRTEESILESLEQGRLPGLIAKEVAEWVITTSLWPFIQSRLSSRIVCPGSPRTPEGVWRTLDPIL